jgi:nuclear transport factor 2 (NTF2) superfamily protein
MNERPPFPPFTAETAAQKARAAEDAWNTCDPERVSLAYTPDSRWRNRDTFLRGRDDIVAFLRQKWARELEYRLIKEVWTYGDNRIAVRFAYESHDVDGQRQRHASINDIAIDGGDRLFHWDRSRPRPSDHPGLTELGL